MASARNISLDDHFETYIKKKVESGRYNSASEVVCDGLRLLEERDAMEDFRIARLRDEVETGINQAKTGQLSALDFNEIKAEGRKRLTQKE
jgi:antitoxin ParD1/3/4